MTTATSLTLRALFSRAASKASLDRPARVIAGLTPAAKALAATLAARTATGITLLVVPTDKDVEQMTSDARFFYAALEGASSADVERAVLARPSLQVDPYRGMTPHFRVSAARARALHGAATGTARLVVASAAALLPRVSRPERLLSASLEIRSGTEIDPQDLADLLVDAGFTREDPVEEHGSFAIRGGIVDIFPAGDAEPVRLEFVGDMVESLRRFDPSTQRSTGATDQLLIVPVRELFDDEVSSEHDPRPHLFEFLGASHGLQVLVSEDEQVREHAQKVREQLDSSYTDAAARGHVVALPPTQAYVAWEDLEPRIGAAPRLEELGIDESARHIRCQPTIEFRGRVTDWIADVRQARERGDSIVFVADSAGRAERTIEILQEYDIIAVPVERAEDAYAAPVLVTVGSLSRGFRLTDAALQIYAETDVFEEERYAPEKRRNLAKTFLSDLRDLKVGDLVVHVDHGIGEFVGLKQINPRAGAARTVSGPRDDEAHEFLELRYQGEDKLFVPVERLDLIQKYTGGTRPALDRLGGTTWEKAKTRVKKAMRDMAEELLKLYAARKAMPGHAFSADSHWQQEFEDAFPYELTPDQVTAIRDIKRDMETATPMDRLLCGDVGYGKTEVAMRAAFKAVMDGKQVAVLAPTTILAFQHHRTFLRRFASFPATIELLTRYYSAKEQKEIVKKLESGEIDVVIGTHRLLSKDIAFKDLGLLVIDEEQRFGVGQKERLKQLKKAIDVVAMSATPIPRSLHMSLVGIRDISVIETPPKDRLAIQTNVVPFSDDFIREAIEFECGRGGQIFFVHNRVESIYAMKEYVERLVPGLRVIVGHGQMDERELEKAMLAFISREYDVLLATTIIENGIDIPACNTILINHAERFGLSQLYQLRGRVGRSDRLAFCYLLVPSDRILTSDARKRLAAIQEFSDLGAGFRIAAKDLEIRGSGNILGGEQSGEIAAIGFEMYTKMLEETIRELKGEKIEEEVETSMNLGVDIYIPKDYVSEENLRMTFYKKIASASTDDRLEQIRNEMRDRFGALPVNVENLLHFVKVKRFAQQMGVISIVREGARAVVKLIAQAKVDPNRLMQLINDNPQVRFTPNGVLTFPLKAHGPQVIDAISELLQAIAA